MKDNRVAPYRARHDISWSSNARSYSESNIWRSELISTSELIVLFVLFDVGCCWEDDDLFNPLPLPSPFVPSPPLLCRDVGCSFISSSTANLSPPPSLLILSSLNGFQSELIIGSTNGPNNDGDATTPAPADWHGIYLNGTGDDDGRRRYNNK